MGYDSPPPPPIRKSLNTDRYIKMDISTLARDPVSQTVTRHIDETGPKWVHKNLTTLTENTMTAMNNINNERKGSKM